jgi:hypothetical protein
MLNINHYITSQANPHIVPFMSMQRDRKGKLPALARMGTNLSLRGSAEVLAVARKHAPTRVLRDTLSTAHALANQTYAGSDMHVQLPFRPSLYGVEAAQLELKDSTVRLGARSLADDPMIRDRTRLSRSFGAIGLRCAHRVAAAGGSPPSRTHGQSAAGEMVADISPRTTPIRPPPKIPSRQQALEHVVS